MTLFDRLQRSDFFDNTHNCYSPSKKKRNGIYPSVNVHLMNSQRSQLSEEKYSIEDEDIEIAPKHQVSVQ